MIKTIITLSGLLKKMKQQNRKIKQYETLIAQLEAQNKALNQAIRTNSKKYMHYQNALNVIKNSVTATGDNWYQLPGNKAYGLTLIALHGYETAARTQIKKANPIHKEALRNFFKRLNNALETGNSANYQNTDRQARFNPENYQPGEKQVLA